MTAPFLKSRLIPSPLTAWQATFNAVLAGEQSDLGLDKPAMDKLTSRFKNAKTTDLSPAALKLGLELANDDYRRQADFLTVWKELVKTAKGSDKTGDKKSAKATDLDVEIHADIIWQRADCYQVLLLIFGVERIDFIEQAWQQMPSRPYQLGWFRRSFRAPQQHQRLFENKVRFLEKAARPPREYREFYQLDKMERVQWHWQLNPTGVHPLEWAAELDTASDLDNNPLFCLMRDIVYNRDAVGKVSNEILRALLASKYPEAWALVEKLLLSAQREEGLRQTIFEALDEGSREAIPHFIKVILDHNLTRFSSIIRGLDVWAGLNWEGEKAATVERFLTLAYQYFEEPRRIDDALQGSNNHAETYMALWVTGVDDIEKTIPMVKQLIARDRIDTVCLAILFISQWRLPSLELPLYIDILSQEKYRNNLQVLAFLLPELRSCLNYGKNRHYLSDEQQAMVFAFCEQLITHEKTKEKRYFGKVFHWQKKIYESKQAYLIAIALIGKDSSRLQAVLNQLDDMPIAAREVLKTVLLDEFYRLYISDLRQWSWSQRDKKKQTLSPVQRQCAFALLDDKSRDIGETAAVALVLGGLLPDELPQIEQWLTSKAKTLPKRLINVILGQSVDISLPLTEKLLHADNTQQRIAGLTLALELLQDSQLKPQISEWISHYQNRNKLTKNEEKLLSQFQFDDSALSVSELSRDNGWGLYDPTNLSPFDAPKLDPGGYYARVTAIAELKEQGDDVHPYGLSKSLKSIEKDLKKLHQLYTKHQDHEYERMYYDGSTTKVLLGNDFGCFDGEIKPEHGQKYVENFPLWQVWNDWYSDCQLTPRDLFLFTWIDELGEESEQYSHIYFNSDKYLPDFGEYHNPIRDVLWYLREAYPFTELNEFAVGGGQYFFEQLSEATLNWQTPKNDRYYHYRMDDVGDGWQSIYDLHRFLFVVREETITDDQAARLWHLYRWRQMTGLPHNVGKAELPMWLYAKAFRLGLINRDELMGGLINSEDAIRELSHFAPPEQDYEREWQRKKQRVFSDAPILHELLAEVREYCLEIELKRDKLDTSVTDIITRFQRIIGVNRLVELLVVLGKNNVYANYLGSNLDNTVQVFSHLIDRCYPAENDTQADFNQAIKAANIPDEKLVQIAIYAAQWQPMVRDYLGWDGFDSGIWWLRAHTKTELYHDTTPLEGSVIARYSAVAISDFEIGAVDSAWFYQAYEKLGKKRWEVLYQNAKYISDGNGHRRAKLYADVLTGKLKIREVTKKIKDKRDQDYVRLYGLVPLSQKIPDKDVLKRYLYLQAFQKESRQFGSQRQSSEASAVKIAMDNLARTAGYPDPMRLSWAMEAATVAEIFAGGGQVTLDDTQLSLVIDNNGKTDIIVEKAGKKQKSIPAKYRKHAAVKTLKAHKKTLTEQFRRAKSSLETAMVRGDTFSAEELATLFEHPVINKLLAKLLFISGETVGFYDNGKLLDFAGKAQIIGEPLRIAHCVDLHASGDWRAYQAYCFDNALQQPFKQIFRELYVPTPDELADKIESKRYAGHQVQPKKTLALLKSRGWHADNDTGLQKVFHSQGFTARIYAMADWFSPADIEAPTLETVVFEKISPKPDEKYTVELAEIDARIFSEVMRDVDLVVSVAHAGEIDPEASQSCIALRTVLLAETLRLFKLDNVKLKGHHAHIDGQLATYSVHLGSAVAHQIGGAYLSILPVHSQHRGRIFLPFMDDDPKTAELLAKVILLAKDNEIKDPTVLQQIKL